VVSMTGYGQGTVLTCTHEECGCRLRVEVECDCPDAGRPYTCTCGAEMVEVDDQASASPG